MNVLTKRLLALGTSFVIAVAGGYLVAPWEGKKNQAYLDIVGVPTICYGETKGVKLGDYYTDEQCEEMLVEELESYNKQMKRDVKVELTLNEEVAYTSLAYNIGVGAFNSSTLLKKLNSGDRDGACAQILNWNKVTVPTAQGAKAYEKRGETCTVKKDGKYSCTVKGLTNRREAEYKICMGKNADVNKALATLSANGDKSLDVPQRGSTTQNNTTKLPTPPEENLNAPRGTGSAVRATDESL